MEETQKKVLHEFYMAFSNGEAERMNQLYHSAAEFEDPAFGKLNVADAKSMWKMLLSKKVESQLSIEYNVIDASRVHWTASYLYGKDKRQIINHVHAHFEFKEGKIFRHIDHFDLWKWTKQAMGLSGHLLGWSNFMKNKIQQTTKNKLAQFRLANSKN